MARLEFQCPKCGGDGYRSAPLPDGSREYQCKGTSYRCTFTWRESEFWQCMQLVTRQPFTSPEAYAEAVRRAADDGAEEDG